MARGEGSDHRCFLVPGPLIHDLVQTLMERVSTGRLNHASTRNDSTRSGTIPQDGTYRYGVLSVYGRYNNMIRTLHNRYKTVTRQLHVSYTSVTRCVTDRSTQRNAVFRSRFRKSGIVGIDV